jgi:hypothetical protein
LSAKAAVPELTCTRAGLDVAYKDYKGDQATERPMNAFDLQAEAVRCPDCALVGIASLTENHLQRKSNGCQKDSRSSLPTKAIKFTAQPAIGRQ